MTPVITNSMRVQISAAAATLHPIGIASLRGSCALCRTAAIQP